jgi:hypothetical protein
MSFDVLEQFCIVCTNYNIAANTESSYLTGDREFSMSFDVFEHFCIGCTSYNIAANTEGSN